MPDSSTRLGTGLGADRTMTPAHWCHLLVGASGGTGGGVEDALPGDSGGGAGVGDIQELQDGELV